MSNIRVLLVDDETLIREGVATILSLQPDIEVVGQALDGLQAVQLAGKTKPDVVLLDLVMPRQDGLHTIPILKDLLPDTKILVLTSFAESDKVYQAVKSGALGYLLKDANRVDLLQAIRDVANGQASIPPSIAIKLIHEIDHPSQTNYTEYPLTDREHQTLQLIARGLSNREIARALFVHPRTVAKYVSNILTKLQLANRTQAALYALKEGLTEPRDKVLKRRKRTLH
jgi:two-component system, NarL family, response regulator LiaR